MGIISSSKDSSANTIPCGGTFDVTLSLTASPDIVTNPVDIVLILDRSGSLAGTPLDNMKAGAKKFIDIIEESTGSAGSGQIGSGSRIGVVSFAAAATQDTQLITSVDTLKNAVDALSAGGSTNQQDAFLNALNLLAAAPSSSGKVFVMFTDGVRTAGGPPAPVAAAAKAQGVIIYVIGLSGNGGIDEDALREWASDPDSAYVSITPDEAELEDLFEDLARNIAKPGATNVKIIEKVNDCFAITSFAPPSKGNAQIIDEHTLEWTMQEFGVTQNEAAVLVFTVQHNDICSGVLTVNESIIYTDDEGNSVSFGDPEVETYCDIVLIPEGCPETVDVAMDGCVDSMEFDAGEVETESLGRILQLDVTIKNVCPGKRVALAVLLKEVDELNNEYKRGMKTLLIPAHTTPFCRDVTVRCIKFVLPEELDVTGSPSSICNQRNFKVQFIAHYVDYDFDCCT